LNAGALPVSIEVVEQRNVGATLGQESVERSIRAGLIGLGLVIIFMVAVYGKLGIIADLALVVYGLITLMLYKLIPVVLTLPGIAGFILSVGMAVDANILIFERLKEELRVGQPYKAAMELAFGRAWDSIRDANVCTLITCFVLFNPFNWGFLPSAGMVRGFALTLGLGIGIGLFTGIIVSRTLIRVFYKA
jgi:preprotein translocase subunit SecD